LRCRHGPVPCRAARGGGRIVKKACVTAAVGAALLWAAGTARPADWPCWRGPTGQGVCPEKDLPLTWSARGGHGLWKGRPPGTVGRARLHQNQASPVVCTGRVFLTPSSWRPGVEMKECPEHHVPCYRLDDGKQLWDVAVAPGPWKLTDVRGGYTAPTPACDGERLYVVFGSSGLAALDLDGHP